jgi:phosphoribosyl 1,2-cyclic phosphodiesterase
LNNSLSTCVLGSSSGGNATLIWNSGTAILIDCGFRPTYIAGELRNLGMEIQDLDGVFITHIHSDHVNEWTVKKLVDHYVPIFCPPQIEPHLKHRYNALARASRQNLLKPMKDSEIELSEFLVRSFEVPHDSDGGCFGFNIFFDADGKTKKISVSTDIARPTPSAISSIVDSDVIVLESNYDVDMLENSSRPIWLKRRIQQDGHLSNDQCGESLLQIIDQSKTLPKAIALAHISQECNTNPLALECTNSAFDRRDISGIGVFETHANRPGGRIVV